MSTSGVPPSRSVIGRGAVGDVEQVAVLLDHAAPLVGAGDASTHSAVALDAHHRGDLAHEVQAAQRARRSRPAAASVARCETTTSWASSPRPSWRTVWIETSCSAKAVRDRGQDAGAVVDVDRDVVAGHGSRPSAAPRTVGVRRLAGAAHVVEPVAGHGDQVAEHRAGGRARRRRRGRRTSAGRRPRSRRRPRCRPRGRWPAGATAGSSPGARAPRPPARRARRAARRSRAA